MQHDGWLETYLQPVSHTQARHPQPRLLRRRIDRPPPLGRLRLARQWLTKTKADVVFAFFGYNESFAGKEGLDNSRKISTHSSSIPWPRSTTARRPRAWSCSRQSPMGPARPRLPDGRQQRTARALHDAMAEVAKAARGRRSSISSMPSWIVYAKAAKPADDQRRSSQRIRQRRLAERSSTRLCYGQARLTDSSRGEAPPGGAR